jgi:CRP/FNR family transcriptional regulator, cyclic AMP receptor protein
MESSQDRTLYRVWGEDKVAHGPVDLITLRQWVKEARVMEGSWVLLEAGNRWVRAAAVPELAPLFSPHSHDQAAGPRTAAGGGSRAGFAPARLRKIKLFADLEEHQLESFAQYFETVQVSQFEHLFRKGQSGEGMYVVLEGELRALTIVEGKECLLGTVGAGESFGEISLLDKGPRSADIIANRDSTLLKLSNAAFERLIGQAPALAVPFVLALNRLIVGRMRHNTQRYEDTIQFIRRSGIKKASPVASRG